MILNKPRDILEKYWGYTRFRPLQEEIIDSILAGKDTLAMLPTGGGKSICFQVPALAQEGICLVISPLIALMKDQVQQLQARNIPAQAIYSGMNHQDIDRHFDNAVYGNTKLLYMSPERLQTDMGRERVKRMALNFIAVDEAHCVSQWGYDFRPSYLNISELREHHPEVPMLALTATATPEVMDDIQKQLGFRKGNVFRQSMERPNVSFRVKEVESKEATVAAAGLDKEGSTIIYARNRRLCEETARSLQARGIASGYYHAGLSYEERVRRQEAWMNDEKPVMVATNAFGMGIDKPDVRHVVHIDLPDSLEAYVQEAGRAGRDGKPSVASLLYRSSDIERMYDWYRITYPPMSEIRQVYQALCNYYQLAVGAEVHQALPFNLSDFTRRFGLSSVKAYHALKVLEQDGWFSLSDSFLSASKVQVTGPREEVFALQRGMNKHAIVLQALLRLYEGIVRYPTQIREQQLVRYCDLNQESIKQALLQLEKGGLITYYPASDAPLLSWLRQRVPARDLQIDMEAYRFRKHRHLDRIRTMERYVKLPVCRRNFILYYFGETVEGRCGQCDVCLSEHPTGNMKNSGYESIIFRLEGLLRDGPKTIHYVRTNCADIDKAELAGVLKELLSEEILAQTNESIYWKEVNT